MAEGWVSLHRELLDKPIWRDSTVEQKVILTALLLMANHREITWEWRGKPYHAKPGQFVTSISGIVKECGKGVSIQNVRTALVRFEKLEFLTDEVTNVNRLITIVNWGFYQGLEDVPNRQSNGDLTKSQQTPNRELTTNNNVIRSSSPPTDITNIYINTHEEFEQNFGRSLSPIELETIDGWLQLDKYNPEVIQVALREAVMNNAYSLKYIDRILLAWERKGITSKSAALANIQKRNERSVSDSQKTEEAEQVDLPEIPMFNWLEQTYESGVK